MEGRINIHRLLEVMSEILSDMYGLDITLTARLKEEAEDGTDEQVSKGGLQGVVKNEQATNTN